MGGNGGRLQITIERVQLSAEEAGKLQVQAGDFVRLAVRDSGCGIPEEQLARIFEPFFTTKEVGKGTGLGLSVVHSIVKDLAGSIRVESRLEQGTLIEIHMPITHQATEQTEVIADNMPSGQGEHIIWVDDEASLVTLGCQILESMHYQAHGFTDPLDCLAAVKGNPAMFSLVVADYNMPKMNGLSLTGKIHQLNPELPIIICSGFSETITAENAREHGLHQFLMKPVRKFDIAAAIDKALHCYQEVS